MNTITLQDIVFKDNSFRVTCDFNHPYLYSDGTLDCSGLKKYLPSTNEGIKSNLDECMKVVYDFILHPRDYPCMEIPINPEYL